MRLLAVRRLVIGRWRPVLLVEAVSEGAEGPVADDCYGRDTCEEEHLGLLGEVLQHGRGQTYECFPADGINEAVDDHGHRLRRYLGTSHLVWILRHALVPVHA